MIHEPGDPKNVPPIAESIHEQTDDELTEKEAKQMEVDDQAIQTILMGLPEDIYEEVGFQLQTKELDLMAIAGDLDEIDTIKADFFINRLAILDSMVWRHPDAAIDDPRPAAGSFYMAYVSSLSAHVIKLTDMPEGVLVLSRLSRVWKSRICDSVLQGADGNADAVILDPTPEDLAVGTPSSKILAKAEASQKRKASIMSTLFQRSGVPDRASSMSTLFQHSSVPDMAFGMSTLIQCSGVPDRASSMSTLFQHSSVPDMAFGMSTLIQCSGVLGRASGHDAAYAITWGTLKKKLIDKYCPKGEIKKLKIKLWNLKLRGNDVVANTQCFQKLALMYTRFLADETEKVDKYISGLPDYIYGNVMSARPKTLDEAIELANDLIDQKLRTYLERHTKSKRKFDNNNQAQQIPKWQNVAQAYAVGTGERMEYARTLPLCNKCKFYHNGPCTTKCTNYKKVGHLTRDCWNHTATKNQNTITCYECGNQGHYKSDCPELKNQKHGNQAEDTGARGMVYSLGEEENNQDLDDIKDDINA
nr:hypothetical protein [Tanacetum cinerariifolium]